MEIYLDCNATTQVLASAQRAAVSAMADDFANPSSTHSAGLRSRAVLDSVRAAARRVMGAPQGRLFFTSGATEGIHTAVLSALAAVRHSEGPARPTLLLYGGTEHKAVPEALAHWNAVLGLGLQLRAIPVGRDGRHDLGWLADHVAQAAMVCTMAANNETGVISDLEGIAAVLEGTQALWLVDSVQALGKLPLHLADLPIDYAPVSGHKLFAPKGVGILYVREGAPFTPMFTGGGQEEGWRSGTENMSGIAAFGAVLSEMEHGKLLQPSATLAAYREQLVAALSGAFPGVVFNAPLDNSLPTTVNFSVPGLGSKLLLDLFDSAGLRVSGGSACSASQAAPSHVLEAMGLPQWQTASAIRMSFAPDVDAGTIAVACTRIRDCGESARASCLLPAAAATSVAPPELVTRFAVDGACCYLVADAPSRRCVVIDPLPELKDRIANWFKCNPYTLVAVLDTHSHGGERDALGWPIGEESIALGQHRLRRIRVPGHTVDSTMYLLHRGDDLVFAFVGDTVMPGSSLRAFGNATGQNALLLPGHDHDDHFASTLRTEGVGGCSRDERVALSRREFDKIAADGQLCIVVDVREAFEQKLGLAPAFETAVQRQSAPLSTLVNALPRWLASPDRHVVFYCRSGNRSAQAARALRRLGHGRAWSLEGGLALNI
ncbi:aminotransferase class V-fold PLP-dependent enzyme [Ramlibacter sp. WS9]|uniref:aminotransferase class V-fold PLP-dependent enzyme n=1 Tax=Ramlibacter sp. WS9 TaxID=1882741 RepID=UPI00114247E9|nr:aminotransferase class V-fold PLP-dependent enzyme [Ramlibacter sp. WS9]ROZ78786.1 aminotransferase class V-fold PLP-dependent enzyme [Ramlibacter sp. WS9]